MSVGLAPHIDVPTRVDPYGPDDLALLPVGSAHLEGGSLVVHTDLTVEALLDAYPQSRHIELIEGRLTVHAAPGLAHADIAYLTAHWLNEQAAPGWKAREAVNVRLDDVTMPISDVALFPADTTGAFVSAHDVALAVEVLSPNDLMNVVLIKIERYLTAGVAAVWVIHPEERRIGVHGATELDPAALEVRLNWPS